MSAYNTEQKKMLIAFLRQNKEKAFTIEEISIALKELYGKSAPGKSTVYRLIPLLAEEGRLTRHPRGRGALYQFLEKECCHGHLHMRCMRCGRLFHLDDSLSDELLIKVREVCGFSVNEKDSLLLGSCISCR